MIFITINEYIEIKDKIDQNATYLASNFGKIFALSNATKSSWISAFLLLTVTLTSFMLGRAAIPSRNAFTKFASAQEQLILA